MRRVVGCSALLILALVILVPAAAAQNPVVRAVLFYGPTCPHCHKVMTEDLPPLLAIYNSQTEVTYLPTEEPLQPDELPPMIGLIGDQLQLIYINIGTPLGQELYWAMIELFNAQDRTGVPSLMIGETMLIGSVEIPEKFPGLIDQALAEDGIDWPDIPGLLESTFRMIPVPTEEATPEDTPSPTEEAATGVPTEIAPATIPPKPTSTSSAFDFDQLQPTVLDKIRNDLAGNVVSIAVLIGLILTAAVAGNKILLQPADRSLHKIHPAIPLLAVLGIIVAGYLAYVETTGVEAVCGPVGDCNTVQQSAYATLFGVIPMGVLGLFGYIAILTAWLFIQPDNGWLSDMAIVAIFGMTAFGTLFSTYLTFLEPFVIGATCAWCLSSAIIITVQMWLAVDPAMAAFSRLRKRLGK